MRYLLDTSVISELRKSRPHGGVLAWFRNSAPEDRALPAIALYELQAGVELTRQQDEKKAAEISAWIDLLAQEFSVLPLDADSARLSAALMHGKSPELLEDAMISAIAIVHNMTVVTRNVRDFEQFTVPLVNPFSSSRT